MGGVRPLGDWYSWSRGSGKLGMGAKRFLVVVYAVLCCCAVVVVLGERVCSCGLSCSIFFCFTESVKVTTPKNIKSTQFSIAAFGTTAHVFPVLDDEGLASLLFKTVNFSRLEKASYSKEEWENLKRVDPLAWSV